MASSIFFLLLLVSFHLTLIHGVGGELIFEDGYTVSTVLDGDKSSLKINPHSIIHQSPPSDLFILLDSVASTFYTVSLSATSNETVIKKLAGNGEASYMDGNLDSARFNKPRSFAVDFNGNVYVADHHNHAIRKIAKSGVSTIAGGYSQKTGRTDGPSHEASFSNDFELTFIPERCALMISDHGNRLVRQINLKPTDCKRRSGSVLGTTSAWLLGIGLSCLFGLITGFIIRPYIMPHEGVKPLHSRWTWTRCLMSQERQLATFCSDIRNALVKSTPYSLLRQIITLSISHLSLMFRPLMLESRTTYEKPVVSLLDIDETSNSSSSSNSNSNSSNNLVLSLEIKNPLIDLITFDSTHVNTDEVVVEQEDERNGDGVSPVKHEKIDGMILANLVNFKEQRLNEVLEFSRSNLIKRR